MKAGVGFLERLRATERIWADPYLGLGWQSGTRWRGGMMDAEVTKAEERYGLTFPPDYRLFLQTLHTTDPERVRYVDGTIHAQFGRPFHDWQGDRAPIDEALAWPLDGLLWSIEADDSWSSTCGDRPTTPEGRAARVRELAAGGPPLIPLMGHRYLVGEPLEAGNPVLSIYGSDVIVYAPTFGTWLVAELGQMVASSLRELAPRVAGDVPAIPFLQDVIDGT
jgi:hypothetical protein